MPPAFRFAVKLPRMITHERRLADCEALLDAFLHETAPLRDTLGCLLIQLPGSFALEPAVAERFFDVLRSRYAGAAVIEPRHASWFAPAAAALYAAHAIGRVGADPARVPEAAEPAGAGEVAYWRLHGSPRMYWSAYDDAALDRMAAALVEAQARVREVWCIFDNTASGAAAANALALKARVDALASGRAGRRRRRGRAIS